MPDADVAAPPTPYTVELSLAGDASAAGRVTLRIVSHGGDPVPVVLPERPDQIEWFAPDARRLAEASLRVAWTAWRDGGGDLAGELHPSTAQRASRHTTLAPGVAEHAAVDLGAALGGADTLARGWCARAWLIGGAHPLPSNVVCWPARSP
jgi:hypothetical protein